MVLKDSTLGFHAIRSLEDQDRQWNARREQLCDTDAANRVVEARRLRMIRRGFPTMDSGGARSIVEALRAAQVGFYVDGPSAAYLVPIGGVELGSNEESVAKAFLPDWLEVTVAAETMPFAAKDGAMFPNILDQAHPGEPSMLRPGVLLEANETELVTSAGGVVVRQASVGHWLSHVAGRPLGFVEGLDAAGNFGASDALVRVQPTTTDAITTFAHGQAQLLNTPGHGLD